MTPAQRDAVRAALSLAGEFILFVAVMGALLLLWAVWSW